MGEVLCHGQDDTFLRGGHNESEPHSLKLSDLCRDELFVIVAVGELETDTGDVVEYERVIQYTRREYEMTRERTGATIEALINKDYLERVRGDRLSLV